MLTTMMTWMDAVQQIAKKQCALALMHLCHVRRLGHCARLHLPQQAVQQRAVLKRVVVQVCTLWQGMTLPTVGNAGSVPNFNRM